MASITRESNGRKTIQFISADGKRRSFRLGKCPMRSAETVRVRVEAIVSALKNGVPVDDETATWLGKRDAVMHDKLAAVGLAEPRIAFTLKAFLDHYDSIRHVKPATHVVWGHTRRNLVDYFGEDKPLTAITEADAEQWREHLAVVEKLSEATIRKRCKFARQFFTFAVKKRLLPTNPFAGLKAGNLANRVRDRFISREDAQAVIDACPDSEWRLIFALSRYGGLRCPSEHLSLRWDDIDWQGSRIRVRSPKTEHHPGHESRVIPIFPELLPYLQDAHELAADGAEFVIAKRRDSATNLRTTMTKIIRRAGLEPWPKLFHNLRATRQTELEESFPSHVVCAWLGNSQEVARRHYLQVTEEHLQKAVQNPVHHASTPERTQPHERSDAVEDAPDIPACVGACGSACNYKVEPLGLEPRTNGL
jgi:integrase